MNSDSTPNSRTSNPQSNIIPDSINSAGVNALRNSPADTPMQPNISVQPSASQIAEQSAAQNAGQNVSPSPVLAAEESWLKKAPPKEEKKKFKINLKGEINLKMIQDWIKSRRKEKTAENTGNYEINLVPDVKSEMIRTLKLRNLVFFICLVVSAAAISGVSLLWGVVGGQNLVMSSQDDKLKTMSNKLNSYANLNDFLTIQDQMSKIATINDNRKVLSRIFMVMEAMRPKGADMVKYSEVNVRMDESLLRFEAQADAGEEPFIDYRVLESFKKNSLQMKYDYGRYVTDKGSLIPTRCIEEASPEGVAYMENGSYYAKWTRYAEGCDPDKVEDDEEEDDGTLKMPILDSVQPQTQAQTQTQDQTTQQTQTDTQTDTQNDTQNSTQTNTPTWLQTQQNQTQNQNQSITETNTDTNTGTNANTNTSNNVNNINTNNIPSILQTQNGTNTSNSSSSSNNTSTNTGTNGILTTPSLITNQNNNQANKNEDEDETKADDTISEDEYNLSKKTEIIYRTPQFKKWVEKGYMESDGYISGVAHFESECIEYSALGSGDDIRWTATNSCMMTDTGVQVTNSSNGKSDGSSLVLRFEASIQLTEDILDFNNKHMMIINPSTRNVTDSYVQIEGMFTEPAADCEEGDTSCNDLTNSTGKNTNDDETDNDNNEEEEN